MERPLEYASSRFAVEAEYDSLSDLKHACKHAAILDIYEFIPVRVNTSRYALKCKFDEDFISTEILPKLRNDTSYTPKVIQIDIKVQFGIEIDYQKAYRSKERALKHINGSHEDAYKYLPK